MRRGEVGGGRVMSDRRRTGARREHSRPSLVLCSLKMMD